MIFIPCMPAFLWPGINRLLRIMKLVIFLTCVFSMYAFAEGKAQKVTLSANNMILRDVMKEIQKQQGYSFFFRGKQIAITRVTANVKQADLATAMNEVLGGLNLEWSLEEGIITIAAKEAAVARVPALIKQERVVSGQVTDEEGSPLAGVTVRVKGSSVETITGDDGHYRINITDAESWLTFTNLGFETTERRVASQSQMDITMKAAVSDLDEVVVVGFGTQKKVNLTGSVATVNGSDIEKQTLTQASQALAGAASGVTVIQNSGQPGRDQGRILIRGMGTFSSAGNSPLVLVDGIAASLNDVNPNDIKSISVLKDASSASIYGARAANGVILVETKQGETGRMKVGYSGYFGYQKPTSLVKLVDSWKYAEFMNEAATNEGRSQVYTDEEIERFKSGVDPENYPNANHYEDLLRSGSGMQTSHDVSFSGGTNTHSYLFSMGYLNQEGLVKKTSFERYNLRLNLDSRLTEKLNLKVRLSGNQGTENEPVSAGSNGQKSTAGMITYGIKIPNTIPVRKADGSYGNSSGFTTAGWLDSESFGNVKSSNFLGSVELEYDLLKSLKISGKAGYLLDMLYDKMFGAELVVDQFYTEGPAQLTVQNNQSALTTLQLLANYDLSLQKHAIHLLAGYSQEASKSNWTSAFRDDFANNSLYELAAGSQNNMRNDGSASQWALQSFFGRLNYGFDDKYLFEANVRYDGSSRFPKHNRYGLFPSFSAGWILSREDFLQNQSNWIDLLKLRASYGQLGNQQIGLYPYQLVLSTGLDYPLGSPEILSPGVSATILPNENITWETTAVSNIGFDMSVFNGKLGVEAEYFYKKTTDILYRVSTSQVLGLTPSEQNAGVVENKGWDFNIRHNNNLGPFSYQVALNFSAVNNKVLKLAGIERDLNNGLLVGYPLEAIYGYVTEGLFIDEDDIANYPTQPYAAFPGEYRFKDIGSENGAPDGVVDPDHDRKVIGSRLPKYSYGMNIAATYKNFDFSMQFRGLAGFKRFLSGNEQGRGLLLGSNVQEWMYENRWTPENRHRNAIYPRALVLNAGSVHNWQSTYWLRDASFLRLSNLQLGYTIPKSALSAINRLRVYASARNLLSFDSYYPGWDPESGGNYPPTIVFTVGINANF